MSSSSSSSDKYSGKPCVYLPQLEDAASIQSAISEVCEMMLHRRIEPKEASALFYTMQVASSNLVHKNQKPNSETSSDTSSPGE